MNYNVEKIEEMLNSCKTIKEIANKLDYNYDNFKRFCRINGIKIKNLNEEKLTNDILNLHEKGETVLRISEILDIGHNKIYHILYKNNLSPNKSAIYHDYDKIQKMIEDGLTVNEVAIKIGASKKHLYEQLKKLGININRFYSFDKIEKIKSKRFIDYEKESKLLYDKYIENIPAHVGYNKISKLFTMHNMDKYKAYYLGVIYGDGCLYKSGYCVDIAMQDLDVLNNINKNLFHNNCYISDRKRCFKMTMYSKKLWDELNLLFKLTNNKSSIIEFPNLDNAMLPHFIRGLLDSDGCFSTKASKKGRLSFSYTSCSKNFMYDLNKVLMEQLNFKRITIRARSRNGYNPCYQMIWSNKIDAKNLGYWIYQDSFGNRGERKFNIWKTYINSLGEQWLT